MLDITINRRNGDEEKFKILSGKKFPYEFDSTEKLNHNQELKREKFYSSFNSEDISEEDFCYYLKVWNILKEKTLGNYSDLCNTQDTLLLGDIFENLHCILVENIH